VSTATELRVGVGVMGADHVARLTTTTAGARVSGRGRMRRRGEGARERRRGPRRAPETPAFHAGTTG